jgi:thiol-disulfide isomerase/thioredoxin
MKLFIALFVLLNIYNYAQEMNTIVKDSSSGKPMLIGFVTRDAFKDTSFSWWFDSEFNNYEPDSATTKLLAGRVNDLTVTIVMGTWCSDSRREVPRFLKLLDVLNFNSSAGLKIICVDDNKKGKGDEVDGLNIELVPTFILSQKGKEIGRIIESPKLTLEKDLLGIISAEN